MPNLPTTAERHSAKGQAAKGQAAKDGNADVLPQALGVLLALPLSLVGTAFLTYLVYAASHLGS